MSLYLVFVQPRARREWDDAVAGMNEVYRYGHTVEDTLQMVTLTKFLCAGYKQRVRRLTFVGHGSSFNFHIGRESISEEYLKADCQYPEKRHIYPALSSLRPFFDPGALVQINACETGRNQSLVRAFSRVLGVPVVAFTGDLMFETGGLGNNGKPKVTYEEGRMTVCVAQMCVAF